MLKNNYCRRSITALLLLIIAGCIVSGCYTYYYFPVPIEDVRLSPVYQLEIQNNTTQPLEFLPRDGANALFKPKNIPINGIFVTYLQIREIRVGDTLTREAVPGPYIDSGRGPDNGFIRFTDTRGFTRHFVIALGSPNWFNEIKQTTLFSNSVKPPTLKVELTDNTLTKTKWFRKGPEHP